ncbi:MAG: glutaminyl-peptide cyclotransferase [Acidimicrobiales bacterium]
MLRPASLLAPLLAPALLAAACGGAPSSVGVETTTTQPAPKVEAATTTSSPSAIAAVPEDTAGSSRWLPPRPAASPARWEVEIIATHPHDPSAFTQGLEVVGDELYESTGRYGTSTLRIGALDDPAATATVALDDSLFGEGLTIVDDRVVQLTWREQRALVWDREDLEPVGTFTYEGEGWGLCFDGDRLVMSDGSARLTFRDPESFAVSGTADVALAGTPVTSLNELECVGGLVLANVWKTTDVVVIDPTDGSVIAVIDASALLADVRDLRPDAEIDVLNGIAALDDGTFLLTGKYWPLIYIVRVIARN